MVLLLSGLLALLMVFTVALTLRLRRRRIQELEDLDEKKSEFITLASHQLRTPLASLRWLMEMLIEGDYGNLIADQRDAVVKAQEIIERMVVLANELLSAEQLAIGAFHNAPKETDLCSVLDMLREEFSAEADVKQITMPFRCLGVVQRVVIDAFLVREIGRCLLSNALQYTPAGGKVDFTVTYREGQLEIVVQDTGCGIPEEDRDKIFHRFYRAKNAMHLNSQGSGLGLYIVQKLTTLLGGSVDYASRVGSGTTFTVRIPCKVVGVTKERRP